MPDNEDPFDEFQKRLDRQNVRQQATRAPTLGQGTPRRSPYGGDSSYYEPRYQSMGPVRRARAGVQNIVSSIPIIRNIPGTDRISPPEDVEIARGARPGLSAGESALGHTAPYAVGGAGLPNLFSTLPRAATMGAGIEGTDAYLGSENPVVAAAAGGASAIPGAALGKVITPRPRAVAMENRATMQAEQLRRIQDLLRRGTGRNRGRFARRPTGPEAEAEIRDITRPPAQLGPISDVHARRLEQMARWGVLGASGGMLMGRPIEGAIIGGLAPIAARAATNLGNRGRGFINQHVLDTETGRQAAMLARRYTNNVSLSDEARAILNAISAPLVMESPQLTETLGR